MDVEHWLVPSVVSINIVPTDWPLVPDSHSPMREAAGSSWNFTEQVLNGNWPVQMPLTFEIYCEGMDIRMRACRRGELPLMPDGHVVTVFLKFDRAKLCEVLVQQLDNPLPGETKLMRIAGLVRVDRQCCIDKAVAHFVETLGESDESLRWDPWLIPVLRHLSEYDPKILPEMVATTARRYLVAGIRLRGLILEALKNARVREHLGSLAATTLTERLQVL